MMPDMNQSAIDRAEKFALKLEAHRLFSEARAEAKGFKKPASLRLVPVVKKSAKVKRYEFTDAQLEIALRSLDAGSAV